MKALMPPLRGGAAAAAAVGAAAPRRRHLELELQCKPPAHSRRAAAALPAPTNVSSIRVTLNVLASSKNSATAMLASLRDAGSGAAVVEAAVAEAFGLPPVNCAVVAAVPITMVFRMSRWQLLLDWLREGVIRVLVCTGAVATCFCCVLCCGARRKAKKKAAARAAQEARAAQKAATAAALAARAEGAAGKRRSLQAGKWRRVRAALLHYLRGAVVSAAAAKALGGAVRAQQAVARLQKVRGGGRGRLPAPLAQQQLVPRRMERQATGEVGPPAATRTASAANPE